MWSMIESRCVDVRRANGPAGFAYRVVTAFTAALMGGLPAADSCCAAAGTAATQSIKPASRVWRERDIDSGLGGSDR